MGTGALVGAGVGTATALGLIVGTSAETTEASALDYVMGTAIFAAGGALLGSIVGALCRKDEWVDSPGLGLSIEGSRESIRMSVGFGPAPTRGRK